MPSQAAATRAVVERFYASIFARDEAAIRACLHDDAELHQPPTLPYGGVYVGPDALMALWQDVVLPLSEPGTAAIETFVAEGDTAVVVATSRRVLTGVRTWACEEYRVRDGRIARIRMFWFDPAPVAEVAVATGVATWS